MPASKIVDEGEVFRWFAEGKTYEEMIALYREKYSVETTIGLWANFRRRKGMAPRTTRDLDLIPWQVQERHRWAYPLQMLRLEGRRRATGESVRGPDAVRHANFLARLSDRHEVVEYRPETPEGFFYVPRQPTDVDLVRRP
ncbi:hypothetical protein GCM10023328_02060 [Modestobacter marinus]|uniref:Immunity repressor n=1 Tax=Modestobacter marinus TaxID=477641 RepID=A0A846LGS1_9ACTN|nr:hypothetical protein [Modestobacter marinus]NIH67363.1 hypothetical protein [Modestobacter marinus]GGL54262.1 hypothetical protein GCM10011589_07900 [Modestobacter marinus]